MDELQKLIDYFQSERVKILEQLGGRESRKPENMSETVWLVSQGKLYVYDEVLHHIRWKMNIIEETNSLLLEFRRVKIRNKIPKPKIKNRDIVKKLKHTENKRRS